MSCILIITGKYLDVEKITKSLSIKPYMVYKKGEYVISITPNKKRQFSGISFLVSKAEFNQLKKQINDATKFLSKHKLEIKKITSNKNVENAVLDFPSELRIGKNVALQSDYFPYELLKLAGDLKIGIEISLYPPGKE